MSVIYGYIIYIYRGTGYHSNVARDNPLELVIRVDVL